jgi:hypothetical protein
MKFFVKYKYGDRKAKTHLSHDHPWPELVGDFIDFLSKEDGPGYGIDPFLKEKIKQYIVDSHFEWALGKMKEYEAEFERMNKQRHQEQKDAELFDEMVAAGQEFDWDNEE